MTWWEWPLATLAAGYMLALCVWLYVWWHSPETEARVDAELARREAEREGRGR